PRPRAALPRAPPRQRLGAGPGRGALAGRGERVSLSAVLAAPAGPPSPTAPLVTRGRSRKPLAHRVHSWQACWHEGVPSVQMLGIRTYPGAPLARRGHGNTTDRDGAGRTALCVAGG